MCPPDHYGIEYEINPWMNRSRQADHNLAVQQWNDLVAILQQIGADISLLEPVPGLPDLVFTANAGLVHKQQIVLSQFRFPERQPEQDIDEQWFESEGYRVHRLSPGLDFEGAGDALFCGETLFAGYRIRSDAAGHQEVGRLVKSRVIPMELVDPYYYHLDTCFCPLDEATAIYLPAAFDRYGRQALRAFVPNLLAVDEEEAKDFACNAVVVDNHVVTNVGCPKLHLQLKERGFEPIETPLSEFVKAGGSAKCLTLRLDGEEAATWSRK